MRKRFRTLIVLASTFAMVLVLGVGTAFANDKGDATLWTCDDAGTAIEGEFCSFDDPDNLNEIGVAAINASAPVGSHIPAAAGPAFEGQAGIALFNNPLCPFHGVDPTS